MLPQLSCVIQVVLNSVVELKCPMKYMLNSVFPRAAVTTGIQKSRFSEYRNYLYIVCLIPYLLERLIDVQSTSL